MMKTVYFLTAYVRDEMETQFHQTYDTFEDADKEAQKFVTGMANGLFGGRIWNLIGKGVYFDPISGERLIVCSCLATV